MAMLHDNLLAACIKYESEEITSGVNIKNNALKRWHLKYYFGVLKRKMLFLIILLFSYDHLGYGMLYYHLNYI